MKVCSVHVLSMPHAQAIPMPPCLLALLHAPCLDPTSMLKPSRPSTIPTYLGPTCYASCPQPHAHAHPSFLPKPILFRAIPLRCFLQDPMVKMGQIDPIANRSHIHCLSSSISKPQQDKAQFPPPPTCVQLVSFSSCCSML